jgi:hypothetical protein
MQISKGLELVGRPAEIPDSSRDDLPEFVVSRNGKVGVEVGVFEGAYTEVMARSGLTVYGVDPWLVYEDYGTKSYQPVAEKRYQKTLRRLAPYKNVTIYRETSLEALKHFEDESLDFVYIDANHQFRYIADDLFEWWKKVKKGGIVAGHDYAYFKSRSPCGGCQVREVVDAYALAFRTNFWVLGRRKKQDGERRDDYRSWFFIKGDQRDVK